MASMSEECLRVRQGRRAVPKTVRILGTSSRERVRSTTASNTCCMRCAVGEDQVAAVLDLIDGEGVAETAALLLIEVKPEAQARGIDPSPTDLAQPPYSRILRQGICDPSQARRVGDGGEAVADLAECYPRRLRLTGPRTRGR